MDLGLNFDDDLFENKERNSQQKSSDYVPKEEYPCWFLRETAATGDSCIHKQQGDHWYFRRQWGKALQAYQQALALLPPSNMAVRRDCLEALSRSSLRAGDIPGAQEFANKLSSIAISVDHHIVVDNLLALIYQTQHDLEGEQQALQRCLWRQPLHPHLWFQLGVCQARRLGLNLEEPVAASPQILMVAAALLRARVLVESSVQGYRGVGLPRYMALVSKINSLLDNLGLPSSLVARATKELNHIIEMTSGGQDEAQEIPEEGRSFDEVWCHWILPLANEVQCK